ncbi:protein of unknown function [Xylanibacter ruminicola]|jgi:hypothetical protein|uniref:DUF4842 domain-containing protein n=1 Tax=Xylanibacter ruminicola TaxID=839 RepID=A0A1H5VRU4_XYLRU|nr:MULTISPECIES: DUF4842 domain-containing protein [Prevotellaceae]SEF89954.1 protein of unknown function [Xylanibacter ruminicola]SEV82536.1 protein of unknown function [Prevotella sp. khp7]
MKKLFPIAICGLLLFMGCSKSKDLFDTPVDPPSPPGPVTPDSNDEISANVQKVFGTTFDPNQDWCTTTSGEVKITANASIQTVQLLVYVSEPGLQDEPVTSMRVLNEATLNGQTTVTLYYDAPIDNQGLFVAFISDSQYVLKKVVNGEANINDAAKTRALPAGLTLPTGEYSIGVIEDSYAKQRGWTNELLYELSDYSAQRMNATPYSDELTAAFRAMVFSYFKNGRSYNNLPLVKSSGFYNENAYPITTGEDPIIVSPVYKCDRGEEYGNEVWNSDLYYYYFKEDDMNSASDPVAYLQSLPKYKAIPFKDCFGEHEDDVINRRYSYALMYFGDGTPSLGTKGSYYFPVGYKIGFMVRAKTSSEAPKKQGELYGDGRLNNKINSWPNFSSSHLGTDGPRLAWLTFNGKKIMCFESGTDADFNDVILEVEGGIEIPFIPIEPEYNKYTFCFEDTPLGDYDMNDIVIKAVRKNETTVEYSIIACGAYDEICIKNINCGVITNDAEVHALFGKTANTFINTQGGSEVCPPVTATKTVPKTFSFLVADNCPYIYDMTTNIEVRLSKKGEDPHGIMIPNDFKYPLERVCIKDAYLEFNNWGEKTITFTDWYTKPVAGKVY